jgi:hypothetical protein
MVDVLHRQRHLIHAGELLLAGGGDLGRRFGRAGDVLGQLADRVAGLGGLFAPARDRLRAPAR